MLDFVNILSVIDQLSDQCNNVTDFLFIRCGQSPEKFSVFAIDSIVTLTMALLCAWLNAIISRLIILSCSDALLLPICQRAVLYTQKDFTGVLALLNVAKM